MSGILRFERSSMTDIERIAVMMPLNVDMYVAQLYRAGNLPRRRLGRVRGLQYRLWFDVDHDWMSRRMFPGVWNRAGTPRNYCSTEHEVCPKPVQAATGTMAIHKMIVAVCL